MTTRSHHDQVSAQFSSQANAYLSSAVHASGRDLQRLEAHLQTIKPGRLLDLGCGAGHASFVASGASTSVVAYDLSESMLDVVASAAVDKEIGNIETCQGYAETLPFEDASFDVVISRYSAHHWHDVGKALREVSRVLKPNGEVIVMDVMSPGMVVADIWLQTVEALRDTSHVRDYSATEWSAFISEAGIRVEQVESGKLALEFTSWVTRMRTPDALVQAIRLYQQSASTPVKSYFGLQEDGSFTTDTIWITGRKPA